MSRLFPGSQIMPATSCSSAGSLDARRPSSIIARPHPPGPRASRCSPGGSSSPRSSPGRSTRAWTWCSSRPPRCRRWRHSRPCCAAAATSRRSPRPRWLSTRPRELSPAGARTFEGRRGARPGHERLILIAPGQGPGMIGQVEHADRLSVYDAV